MSREEERILIDRLGRLAWRWGRHINPAVVTLRLVATTWASTTIQVRGVAKVGLIPQRAGRRAAERVVAALRASGWRSTGQQ